MRRWRVIGVVVVGMLFACAYAQDADRPLVVAVAASFAEVQEQLAAQFTAKTGVAVQSISGSTGKLYAQIVNGAPFDVFLAADEEHPALLESQGLAESGLRVTYAIGRLALVSFGDWDSSEATLRANEFSNLAIANPELAPYGAAAKQVLQLWGFWDAVQPKLVVGESIAQAYQFVSTRNADLGFVALSQLTHRPARRYWVVPAALHDPIVHEGVVLTAGDPHPSAQAYLHFLRSPEAMATIQAFGYSVDAPAAVTVQPVVISYTTPVPVAPVWSPIWVTLKLATVTTILLVVLATPLAWWLARGQSWLRTIVEALVAMPLVLPPTVLGFYLLVILSPEGILGGLWEMMGGPRLVFSFPGLVIGSMIFSLPFVVQPIQNAFMNVGTRSLDVAATLRAGPLDRFFSVVLPMSRRGFVTAGTLGFAHTVGEFGVVLMIGGSIPERTQVVSIAIYEHVESLQYAQAHLLAAGLLAFSFAVLLLVYGLHRRAPLRLS